MRRLGAERESLGVIFDQIGTPTYAGDLADAIVSILPQMKNVNKEIYHFSNEGVSSWYDFAVAIMNLSDAGSTSKCNTRCLTVSVFQKGCIGGFEPQALSWPPV